MDRRIALSILLLSALRLPAADGDRTVVAMHLNLDITAWSGQGIDFGLPRDAKVIAEPGAARDGKVAGAQHAALCRHRSEGHRPL
jgi:hypothetical protein